MVREDRGADETLARDVSKVGLLSELVGWGVEDRERVLWSERRELEVVGRGSEGESWVTGVPDRDVEEVAGERLLLPLISSELIGTRRGLGASEGVSLATRLCAYELNASGVEKGA